MWSVHHNFAISRFRMEASGKRYIPYTSCNDVFTLWGLGDLHLGNPGCDLSRIKRDIKEIEEDPFSIWVGLGDYGDYIQPSDKRFSADSLDDEAKLNLGRLGMHYMERARDLFMPIRHKCLGLILGNHEDKYFRQSNWEDGHSWLCQELEVKNLRYSALMDVVFLRGRTAFEKVLYSRSEANLKSVKSEGSKFRLYCHHGSGGAATPSGKLNALIRHMNNFEADVYMMGHVHQCTGQKLVRLGADDGCKKLVEYSRIGAICGSYLKTYKEGHTGYGEIKGYSPTALGPAKIRITPYKRELHAEI